MRQIEKPRSGEYSPYQAQYIELLPDDGSVLSHMKSNFETTKALLLSLPEEKLRYRYADSKWTIKEILLHISDDERIYAYRALRFARGDTTELPGFDQDAYALNSGADQRAVEDMLEEFASVREATISLFAGFSSEALTRAGVANGIYMSVRAIAYHIAGHELRHMNIIRERYL